VLEAATDVRSLPGFAEGWISVQDEAAQLAADLLDWPRPARAGRLLRTGRQDLPHPRSRTGLAGVVAVDLEAKRLVRVRENLDAWAERRADRRRRPRHRQLVGRQAVPAHPARRAVLGHRRDPPSPGHQADPPARRHRRPGALQGELLDALWPTLEVGGILLYATCSTLPTENTEVIEPSSPAPRRPELDLATSAGIKQPHGRQLLAQEGGHDGFYYAKLIKIAAARG
jgi:16S rRNA (cytosine967-C5)-methyltransferase